ncbi:GNAT family N-acetyltransferase [Phenylobacterium sp.]|uniref:GNAT family N-acetyltransferase n=1 Tax=Phenylobacterium sp. TaxID=1871053 RepID=UPI0030F4020A
MFEALILASWRTRDTLFSASVATLATDGSELLGLEIGFDGPDFQIFQQNLAKVISDLVASGDVDATATAGLATRARKARYLNAHLPRSVYYLHALSVQPRHRGRGVGARLLTAAIERARARGRRELQLDVLSDNPAVKFYRAMGLRTVVETVSPELTRDHGFPSELRMALAL